VIRLEDRVTPSTATAGPNPSPWDATAPGDLRAAAAAPANLSDGGPAVTAVAGAGVRARSLLI